MEVQVLVPGAWYLVPGTWPVAGYMCDMLANLFNHYRPCVEGPCVTLGPPLAEKIIIGCVAVCVDHV